MEKGQYNFAEKQGIKLFRRKHSEAIKNPVMKGFLKDEGNSKLLIKSLIDPTQNNEEKLDQAFKEFFIEIRLIKYISQLIHFHHLNLNKGFRKYKNHFPLYLDREISGSEGVGSINVIDTISSNEGIPWMDHAYGFEKVKSEALYSALQSLTEKQKEIINLYYFKGFNDREIGQIFDVSQQSIAKTRKRILEKIFNFLKRN